MKIMIKFSTGETVNTVGDVFVGPEFMDGYRRSVATITTEGIDYAEAARLVIDRAGALKTTIQEYLDLTCGTVFLAPKQSKTIKLYHPCFVIYLEFYLVDSVNVAGSNLLYMSNVNNATETKGYLTATFDTDKGTYVALTNNHSTNCMFVNYGCKDLRQTDD